MSIKTNATYNLIGALAPLLVALLTVPPYLRVIGLERYGAMSLFWVVLTYFGLFDLGLGRAVSQRVASLGDASDARTQGNAVVWGGLVVSTVLGCLGALLLMPVVLLLIDHFNVQPGGLSSEIRASVPLLAATLPATMLQGIAVGALTGRERFAIVNLVEGLSNILTVAAPLAVAVLLGPALANLIAAVLAVRLLAATVLLAYAARAMPLRRPVMPDRAGVMRLLGFGGWVTVDGLVGTAIALWDRFIVGAMLGAAAVSIYAIPSTLVMRLLIIPSAIGRAFFPRLARVADKAAQDLTMDGILVLSLVLAPAIVGATALAGPFLALWIGSKLAVQSAPVACILLPAIYANGIASLWATLIQARARPSILAWLHIGELVPYALMLFFAIRWYGVQGAALAWSVRTIVDAVALGFLSRLDRRATASLMLPMGLVIAAAASAYLLPAASLGYWLVQGLLLALTVGCVVWQLPPRAWTLIRALFDRLSRRTAPLPSSVPPG